ncbi:MAG: hypothetical protein C0596_08600 [Marinilabiliales bacterium]|nr:MAG: hypothetical protein C0596_08600 [Marinilabiliales bacterium]
MSIDDYKRAMNYELLVRNAFDCPSGMRNGAHLCFMQNAMTMERGETYANHLGSFEKQFGKVKNYTSKALIKLTKTKPYSSQSDFFKELNDRLVHISTIDELMGIVDIGLDKLVIIKNS